MLTWIYRHFFRLRKGHPAICYPPVRSAFDIEVHRLQRGPDGRNGVQRGEVFCGVVLCLFQGMEGLALGPEDPVRPVCQACGEWAQILRCCPR